MTCVTYLVEKGTGTGISGNTNLTLKAQFESPHSEEAEIGAKYILKQKSKISKQQAVLPKTHPP
jgi:hypothetical protein